MEDKSRVEPHVRTHPPVRTLEGDKSQNLRLGRSRPRGNAGVRWKGGGLAECGDPGKRRYTPHGTCHPTLTCSSVVIGFSVGLYSGFRVVLTPARISGLPHSSCVTLGVIA